jgi:ribosomal protein L11 methyltransferase
VDPRRAGHPFRVLAPADAAAATRPTDLVLERGAFGGGTHPTTASCLELLAALAPLTGVRLLDLGSGTGILAIAAVRLGAAGALCVDVNPDAVASARRNGVLNGVDGRLEHRCGGVDDLEGAPFDLVVANIGGELLLDAAERVVAAVRDGGRLLLSGLLRDFGDELAASYGRVGCELLARRPAGDFCTLLLRRR